MVNNKARLVTLISVIGLILQVIGARSQNRSGGGGAGRTRIKMSDSERFWNILRSAVLGASLALSGIFLAFKVYDSYSASTEYHKVSKRLEGILADREEEEDAEEKSTKRKRRDFTLTSYEQSIATEVVRPTDIPVSFDDIGGLDDIISDLQESVIYPLTLPHLYRSSSSLLSAPSGVLLYGPPGCGKTMLAKALAHESGAVFINLHISTLTEKWYGDSNKLVAAVFSLARKLQPAIVFIDEIDAVFGTRRSGEHEASGMVKAEMMTHWDGLASANKGTRDSQRILVLGATNRIHDIDDAILRRMPKRFAVGLPDAEQRRRIFKLILKDTKLDETVDDNGNERHFDMDFLVKMSEGLSGSDIKEACREAAMTPMREYLQQTRKAGRSVKSMRPGDIRGLRTEDFFAGVLNSVATSRVVAGDVDDDGYVTTDDEGKGKRYEDSKDNLPKK